MKHTTTLHPKALLIALMALFSPCLSITSDAQPATISLTADEQAMVTGSNGFAFNLMRAAKLDCDLMLSPLSITYALGMLNNGATGLTQQEINQVLGFGTAGADGINAFCRKMLTEAGTLDKQTTSRISNAIFVNQGFGYSLQEPFAKTVADYYNAMVSARNFADGETMDVINKWASDQTDGMIPKVLDETMFDPTSVSYLLNAILFKGTWTEQFETKETREEAFGSEGKMVQMMHREEIMTSAYADDDLCQRLCLPYGNGAYAMTILLPREGKTIDDVLAATDAKNWQVKGGDKKGPAEEYSVELFLPRFETTVDIDLQPLLESLGMSAAFAPMTAEFPYFCDPVNGFFISLIKQNAKITVDEAGTKAAAVTTIGVKTTSLPKKATMRADRPFLYVISEQSTGAIFFIGKYVGKEMTMSSPDLSGISSPTLPGQQACAPVYNLQGQRLSAPPANGLFIQGGKLTMRRQTPSRR